MKEIIVSTWSMVKAMVAYALLLTGMVIGIPGHLLERIGCAVVGLGEKIIKEKRVNNGPAIVNEIKDV